MIEILHFEVIALFLFETKDVLQEIAIFHLSIYFKVIALILVGSQRGFKRNRHILSVNTFRRHSTYSCWTPKRFYKKSRYFIAFPIREGIISIVLTLHW